MIHCSLCLIAHFLGGIGSISVEIFLQTRIVFACIEGFNHTLLLDRVESKAFRLTNSSCLTVFSLSIFAGMLPLLLSSIVIFMLAALLILLTACLLSSCGLTAQEFFLPLIPILSNSLMQELTSTCNDSFFFW